MTDFLDRLKEKLISEEGMELMPYHCPKVGEDAGGKLSIGVGRNLEERGITAQEAIYLLQTDIEIIHMELDRNIPFWKALSDNKKLVLCDMAFNLGVPKLMQFKKMLLSLHPDNRDDEEAAAQLLDSNYARQLPARSKRNAELIREG